MPTCARAVQQADGSLALVLDPSEMNVSTCAYVVQSGSEIAAGLVALSVEDGAKISTMIVSLWAAAWGVRAIISMIRGSSNETV